jgi:WD40 repeat protein
MRKFITLSAGLLLGGVPTRALADRPQLVLQTGPEESVTSVAVSPDGALVATGSFDGRARIYDARTGALVRAIGIDSSRGVRALAFSPDGKRLACGGLEMDKTVKL